MARFLNVKHIKDKCHKAGKIVSSSFINQLVFKMDETLDSAIRVSGSKKTLKGDLITLNQIK